MRTGNIGQTIINITAALAIGGAAAAGTASRGASTRIEMWTLRGVPLEQAIEGEPYLREISKITGTTNYIPAFSLFVTAEHDSVTGRAVAEEGFASEYEEWFMKFWRNDGTPTEIRPGITRTDSIPNVAYIRTDSERLTYLTLLKMQNVKFITHGEMKSDTTAQYLEKEAP